MEGIDKCRFVGGNRAGRRPSTSRPITTTTSSVTEKSTLPVTIRQAPALPESEEEEVVDEERKEEELVLLSGCLDAGRSGTVKVGVSRPNEEGRDFHVRVCDQETSGGGWTVGASMSSSFVVIISMLSLM